MSEHPFRSPLCFLHVANTEKALSHARRHTEHGTEPWGLHPEFRGSRRCAHTGHPICVLTLLFVEAVGGGGRGGGEGKAFPLHAPAASIWCCCLELGCGVCETLGAPIPSESAGAKMSMVNFAFYFLDLSMPTLWAPG